MIALSEESKVRMPERIAKVIDVSRVAIHYGYLPLILYLGYTRSDPRPSIIRYACASPFPKKFPHLNLNPLANLVPDDACHALPVDNVAVALPDRAKHPLNLYMPDHRHGGPSPAVVESVAGLSAGVISTVVVHPLDIVKTRMQIYRSAGQSASPPTTVAILRSLTSNSQPMLSLYRGLTPNLVGNATSWAFFFFFKSRFERAIAYSNSRSRPSAADYFLASGLAGASTSVLTNPIWVLKTRMLSSDKGSAGAYPSMLAGARAIWRTEGARGFYRGLGVSLLGVSHGAVQFAVYEPAKRVYFSSRVAEGDAHPRLTNEATVVISSAAKLIAGAVTYPYQVLRSRMQNYRADERFGKGIRSVTTRIWAEEGAAGFYRGLVPGVVRVMPATWVTFLVYENVRYYLPAWLA
ncbi:Mitochondrial carrier domain protein [Metarhizium album ARSEF 1941]|uniref:Mitochondrial carrier domain protein n=1 Tax=Metarhizium album (strain ARSEF 1941) TaxID=1081103 RepID=A0A0B2X6Y7_METAS|nr:Mitochondrial carrier domain protein [Metarhizium album ARSEF 1941]KHO01538.1 Mitochondrial carrier domain protein [Metarhizium album ARSEF 1941]